MKNYFALILLSLGFIVSIQAQSGGADLCVDAEPLCGSDVFSYPNTVGVSSAEPGPNYGCLGSTPNPAWFFIQIGQSGNVTLTIEQSSVQGGPPNQDVDFILYGPFNSPSAGCASGLTSAEIVDCSYSPNNVEFVNINNANSGDYYLLLITNFSNQSGFITTSQTAGTGETNCGILADEIGCTGETITLDATTVNAVNYIWSENDGAGNFNVITGQSGPTLDVTVTNFYRAEAYDANGILLETYDFNVNFFDQPSANPVNNQFVCDTNNDGFWTFDFSTLEPLILGGQSAASFNISYHSSFNDADINANPLSVPYTNQTAFQQETIFYRVENASNTDCYAIGNFLINVYAQPTANAVTYELCDNTNDGDDTNGFVEFDLSTIESQILGTQDPTLFNVSFHANQTNADNNTNPLPNLYTNTLVNGEQIVVRVENASDSSCYSTALITLQVNSLPIITSYVELRQCDNDADGISDFNLTEANALISTNAANETFTYYLSSADADAATNAIANPTAYTNTDPSANPDVIFVRVETIDGCYRLAQLDLYVSASQIPTGFNLLYEACDDDAVDGDNTNGITTFDFSSAEAQIIALFGAGQDITVTYYENEADALAEQNAIPDISNHRNDTSPFTQNIYVRVDNNTDNSCSGLGHHITLTTINPTPNLDPNDLVLCDDITIGDLQEVFDLTVNETYIFNGDPNVFASYYLTANDAELATNAIPNPAVYTNTNPTETIYVRVENSNSGCYARVEFDITVNPLPDANITIADFQVCENNTDFVYPFDLETKNAEILNGQDPNQFSVTYHETQADADALANPLVSPYNNTSNPQQIFVAITNTTTGCSVSILNFMLEVIEGAEANSDGVPIVYEICDNVGDNDGLGQFDLTTQDAEVLDGQDPAQFTLTYHDSMDDALNNIQPLPTLYENTSIGGNPANPQIIYARVSNNLDPDVCFEIAEVTLQVNLHPIFDLDDIYILCQNINGSEVVDVPPVLDTQLSDADYSFEWSLNGTVLPTETSSSLIPTQGGIYSVVVTDISTSTVTQCTSTDSAEVIESEPPVVTAEVTSDAFSGNHRIEATATGSSTYEFSLDYGPWQDNGSFEEVSAGEHIILARDVKGCGIGTTTVLIIDYPKYFTPNGDGNHESWNIVGIDTQPFARIYIFDRYGKLLKQLDPLGPGWDGTYRGAPMPSSDYWFRVEYNEPRTGERKEFTAHFSLKR